MSSLVSCLLMSANNQKDDILLQRKRIKQNSKLFLYILDDFLQLAVLFDNCIFVNNYTTYIFAYLYFLEQKRERFLVKSLTS